MECLICPWGLVHPNFANFTWQAISLLPALFQGLHLLASLDQINVSLLYTPSDHNYNAGTKSEFMKIKKIFSEENGHDIPARNPSLFISIFHINSNHVRMLLNSVESDWSHLRFLFWWTKNENEVSIWHLGNFTGAIPFWQKLRENCTT